MRRADGLLAIIGSGETSPTMVSIHRTLLANVHLRQCTAVLLETPYAFQENVDDVSTRARSYFARSVGLDVTVLGGTSADDLAAVRAADWVFAGPGSPSYALARWRDELGPTLRDRVAAAHGVTVLASAAAATAGAVTVPVYEIYKVGATPQWLDGLDLLGVLGLDVAVIPHYDNAEGGTHDTRYCYLGERRLAVLEAMLPDDAAVLGVDEHTAMIIDIRAGMVQIAGRGVLTVRKGGVNTVLPAGTILRVAHLRELVERGVSTGPAPPPVAAATVAPADQAEPAEPALPDLIAAAEHAFDAAAGRHDGAGMATAVLDLEAAIHAWAADTDEDQGTEQARAVLRTLVARLGEAASPAASADFREALPAVIDALLALRSRWRRERRYDDADRIRDALLTAGLRVHDTADGTRWFT